MGINWTNYFSKKYIFFIELGKTHQEVVEILKRNLKHHKKFDYYTYIGELKGSYTYIV